MGAWEGDRPGPGSHSPTAKLWGRPPAAHPSAPLGMRRRPDVGRGGWRRQAGRGHCRRDHPPRRPTHPTLLTTSLHPPSPSPCGPHAVGAHGRLEGNGRPRSASKTPPPSPNSTFVSINSYPTLRFKHSKQVGPAPPPHDPSPRPPPLSAPLQHARARAPKTAAPPRPRLAPRTSPPSLPAPPTSTPTPRPNIQKKKKEKKDRGRRAV